MPKESFHRPGMLLSTCSCNIIQAKTCAHPTINYDELKHITQVLIGRQISG